MPSPCFSLRGFCVTTWRVRTLHLLAALLFFPGFLFASGAGKGHGPQPTPSVSPSEEVINQPLFSLSPSLLPRASSKAIFQRVLQARLYHSGSWTLADSSQTPVTAGRTLASLRPSFLTGLLRVSDHGEVGNAEVDAFNTVRTAVLASSKGCRFDIVLHAGTEHSGETIVRHMKEIFTRLHPDAWTFYVAPDSTSVNPEVFEEGIAYAHSQGLMAGYDGPLSLIPEGVDYIVVRAWDLKVNRSQIERLREKQRVPVIVELPSSFGNKPHPDYGTFVEKMTSQERGELLANLAENQNAWGYRFAYPVFYPVSPAKKAFDATKDNILLVSIRSLLARYN